MDYPFSIDPGDPPPRYHIILCPPDGEISMPVARRVAKMLELDPYMARQILKGSLPRILKSYVNTQQAEPECEEMASLGLEVFVAKHADLFEGPAPMKTRLLEFEPLSVSFLDRHGERLRFALSDLRFVVKGRRMVESPEGARKGLGEASPRVDDFGLGPARLGLNPRLKVAGERHSDEIEYFLLFFTDGPLPVAEIGHFTLHYDFLGEEKKSVALGNFTQVTRRFDATLTAAVWDSSLEHGLLLGSAPNDRNARLARLFKLPLEQLTARLFYRVHRHRAASASPEFGVEGSGAPDRSPSGG